MNPDPEDVFVWHEYPIGLAGDLASSITRTLLAFLTGIGGVFLVLLAVGLLAEEGPLPWQVADVVDQFARASMLPVLALVWAATLAVSLTTLVSVVRTSKALARAADDDAPVTQVPAPRQVEAAIAAPGNWLQVWSVFHLVMFGLFAIVALWMLVADSSDVEFTLLILGVSVGGGALLIGVWAWLNRGPGEAQKRRRKRISDHWWPRHEQAAWTRAQYTDAATKPSRRRGRGAIVGLTTAGSVGMVAGMALLFLLVLVTHPDAQLWPGGKAGERAELTEQLERLVDGGTIAFAVLMGVSLLAVFLGCLGEGLLDLRERRDLRRLVADPDAARPAPEVLLRHAEPRAPLLAQTLVALGAAAIVLGWAAISLADGSMEGFASVYDGSSEAFGDLLGVARIVRNVGIVLVVAGFAAAMNVAVLGRDLRNSLMARWPQRPRIAAGEQAKNPALVGPALTP